MIADNCCRKSSNRPVVAVVATGETVDVGRSRPKRAVAAMSDLSALVELEISWISDMKRLAETKEAAN
jgi:predicted methyltransferase MtxX (methanogen marker protein 4)